MMIQDVQKKDTGILAWEALKTLPIVTRRLLGLDAVKQEQNMPLSHIQVLALLEEQGTATVSQISRRFGIAKSNITPLVDRLIELKYVERTRSAEDRRIVNITLCAPGRERLAALHDAVSLRMAQWAGEMPPDEYAAFSDALRLVCETLSERDGP